MNKRLKNVVTRAIGFLLALTLVFGYFPSVSVYAENEEVIDNTDVEEELEEEIEEKPEEEIEKEPEEEIEEEPEEEIEEEPEEEIEEEFEEVVAIEAEEAEAEPEEMILLSAYDETPEDFFNKTEVTFTGIEVKSKDYDGLPIEIDFSKVVPSTAAFMDYSELEFNVEGTMGTVFNYADKRELPSEVGNYVLTMKISENSEYFYGEQSFAFEIRDKSTYEELDKQVAKHDAIADDKHVKATGRTKMMGDVRWLTLSAGQIEFKFYGTSASIDILGDKTATDPKASDKRAHIAIELDGVRVIDTLIDKNENTYDVLQDFGQKAKWHTVSVIKLSEVNQSSFAITGIHTMSAGEIEPTENRRLNIEFVGDSITCGYGVKGQLEDPFMTETEDCTMSFAGIAAKKLNADYSLVSSSGSGAVSGYSGDGNKNTVDMIPRIYDKLAFNADSFGGSEDQNVYVRDRAFDVVVVNLGTNDSSYVQENPERIKEFYTEYRALVERIREANPEAYIICSFGMMWSFGDLHTPIKQVVADLNAAGDEKVYYLALTQATEYGSGSHPSASFQKLNGENLARYIQFIMQ